MSDEVLVKVEGVRKKFCRSLKRSLWYGVKDMAAEVIGHNGGHKHLRDGEFWAVNDVSFELRRGECLGLIGRNGAGKTTLLKMLNGLIKPDKGTITMRGRVGALIALGAGFNPLLTGRENIYVNGAVLGLTKKEIDGKIEDILEFADIREFIDSPVQSYSSGMQVRLGFAVATALEPDVLLIDEILAVGDFRFRAKCFNRIASIRNRTALIFVSHNAHDLGRVCDRGLVLDSGNETYHGEIIPALQHYEAAEGAGDRGFLQCLQGYRLDAIRIQPNKASWGGDLTIEMELWTERAVKQAGFRIGLMDSKDEVCAEWRSANMFKDFQLSSGLNRIRIVLKNLCLQPGTYHVNVVVNEPRQSEFAVFSFKQHSVTFTGMAWGFSRYLPEAEISLQKETEFDDSINSQNSRPTPQACTTATIERF